MFKLGWWSFHPMIAPLPKGFMDEDTSHKEAKDWMNKATDEIERLQTEIKRINGHVAGELLPEINRLREERDAYRQELDGMIKACGVQSSVFEQEKPDD